MLHDLVVNKALGELGKGEKIEAGAAKTRTHDDKGGKPKENQALYLLKISHIE